MLSGEIKSYAKQLYDRLGDRSIAHAAQQASKASQTGKEKDAEMWRRIESALLSIRGPHQA
ncbi:MAG: hypothetical protein AAF557_20345 [Pseudomonadota bacterium]